jgi:hypothetical protein
MKCTYRKFIRPFPLKPLSPEVLPFIEVIIVRAPDAPGPVIDVTLAIEKTLQNVDSNQQKLDWYAADCPPIDGAK